MTPRLPSPARLVFSKTYDPDKLEEWHSCRGRRRDQALQRWASDLGQAPPEELAAVLRRALLRYESAREVARERRVLAAERDRRYRSLCRQEDGAKWRLHASRAPETLVRKRQRAGGERRLAEAQLRDAWNRVFYAKRALIELGEIHSPDVHHHLEELRRAEQEDPPRP